MEYHIIDGNQRRGPFPRERLLEQGLRPDTLVWREGMADWDRADQLPELRELLPDAPVQPVPPRENYGPPRSYGSHPSNISGTKIAAGICGILLGEFGIHKFILGLTTPALIMLVVTVATCGIGGIVMWVIGLIEGIIYLTRTDDEFYQTYMVEKKAWF